LQKKELFTRKFIIRALAVIGLYVAAISYIFKNEEHFFFNHNEIPITQSFSYDVPFKEMNIKLSQEIQLHALLFLQENPKGLILFFPSGEYDPLTFRAQNNALYQEGYSVLIPDYRGTGKSNSKYQTGNDIYIDAQQWYKMAKSIADSLPLIIYGNEFGCASAAWIGGEYPTDLILLESPFYSWNKIMLKKYFWWTPHSYLSQFEIPVWKFIRKSTNRIVLVHASDSKFIKYQNSQKLLEFLKPGDELITLNSEDKEQYQENMTKVLSQIIKLN
jgi:pimeloyl-ACP methyl ester carboxylesterase